MNHRLGRSAMQVSRFGLGSAALGGMYRSVEDEECDALVASALSSGITYIDTAPQYGHGRAEQRLGRTLAATARSAFVVSTKVGRLIRADPNAGTGIFMDAPPSVAEFAFDRDSVLRSLEESLVRLGLDRIDIVYIHDPDDHVDEAIDLAYPVLHELRDAGVVGAVGVGMNQSAVLTRFVKETDIDVVLLAGRYTLLDQSATADLLPAARARGVSVVIGGVFNSGILAGADGDAMFNYRPAPPEIRDRVQRLEQVCARHGVELAAAALAFPLRERSVASILFGARDRGELNQNVARTQVVIPESLWSDLSAEGLIDELGD